MIQDSEFEEKPHWIDRAIYGIQDSFRRRRDNEDAELRAWVLDDHLHRTVNSYFDAKIKPEIMVSLLNDNWDIRRSESLEIIRAVEGIRARKQQRAEIDKKQK